MAIFDPNGTLLTPGNGGADCRGNGQHFDENDASIACCCAHCRFSRCCNTLTYRTDCLSCPETACPRAGHVQSERRSPPLMVRE